MGGYGSGSWQQRKRGTVEEHLPIRVGELQRSGVLTPGSVAEIRAGDRFCAEVEAEEHRLVFRYAVGRRGGNQWTRYAVSVPGQRRHGSPYGPVGFSGDLTGEGCAPGRGSEIPGNRRGCIRGADREGQPNGLSAGMDCALERCIR